MVAPIIYTILTALVMASWEKTMHHFEKSIFWKWGRFFNANESWKNKYINRDPAQGLKPLYKYAGALVTFTDYYHIAKNVVLILAMRIGSTLPAPIKWYEILALWAIYTATFSLGWNYLFAKKK